VFHFAPLFSHHFCLSGAGVNMKAPQHVKAGSFLLADF